MRSNPSSLLATGLHARFERATDSAGANAKRIHRDAQPVRHVAAAIDLLPPRVAIVLNDQLALIRLQLLQTAIEALEALLPGREAFIRLGERHPAPCRRAGAMRLVKVDMYVL